MPESTFFAPPHANPPRRESAVLRIGSDRMIAMCRVIMAVLSLCSILIDPARPPLRYQIAYSLLIAYLVISLIVLLAKYRGSLRVDERWALPLHIGDILVLSAVVYLTEGTTRAVFGFYVYLLLAAHIRWRWQGTLWTAAAVLVLYLLALGFSVGEPAVGDLDLDGIIVRIGSFVIATAVLVYFGHAQDAAHHKILAAVDWPTVLGPEDALGAYMEQAAKVLETRGVAFVWVPDAGDVAELVFWSDGRVKRKSLRRDWAEALVDPDISAADLFHWSIASRGTVLISPRDQQRLVKPPVPMRLLRACSIDSLLGIRFQAHSGYGYILARRRALARNDIVLTRIIASRFQAWAEEMGLVWLLNETQAREQRFELATELHGTVLQILAATFMQLQLIAPRLAIADPETAVRVNTLLDTLARENAALRRDLQKFTASSDTPVVHLVQLQRRLQQLAQAVQRQWRLQMDWHLEPPNAKVTRFVDRQLSLLLAEAAADAKRHSDASHLVVSVNVQPNDIRVTFSNGRTRGSPDEAGLAAFAPSTLRRRVARLGGALKLHADDDCVALDIRIPVQ